MRVGCASLKSILARYDITYRISSIMEPSRVSWPFWIVKAKPFVQASELLLAVKIRETVGVSMGHCRRGHTGDAISSLSMALALDLSRDETLPLARASTRTCEDLEVYRFGKL